MPTRNSGRIVARLKEAAMTVKAILADKGGDVVTIDPTANLAAAARQLAERRIGAVLVLGADRRVAGILSERDIVRSIAASGAEALNGPVSQSMTRKVVTCSPNDTLDRVLEQMTAGKFRHVPVLEQGQLAGIISIGDVVKYRLQAMEREQAALQDYIRTA
jgi:CBS domain-containing protein